MRVHVSWIAVLGLVVGLLPGKATGLLDIDITFSAGALPGDFGFGGISGPDADIDQGAGVWNANYGGGSSFFRKNNQTLDSGLSPIVGPFIHGETEVAYTVFGTGEHQLVAKTQSANYSFVYLATDGFVTLNVGGVGTAATLAVGNNDGQEHTYGWDINVTTSTARLFFDGGLIGDAGGYSITGAGQHTQDTHSFGHAQAGGPTAGVYDRITFMDGAFPEPGTLSMLAAGAMLLVSRRRRA